MSVSSTIAKNTVFNFITSASDQVINFGIGIILARYLGPEGYGLYAFLMWFLLFGVYFSNLGLGYMIIRFVAESLGQKEENTTRNYINLAILLRIAAALLVTVVIIVFSGNWASIFGYPDHQFLFVVLSFGILPYVLTFLLTSIFAGFQKYEYGAYLTLGTNPLRALAIIILAITGGDVQDVIIANVGSWVLGVIIGIFLLRCLVPLDTIMSKPKINPETKRALKYSMVMMGVMFIGYFLNQRAEILFLGIFDPGESVAFYNVAFLLGTSSVGLILAVFSGVLVPAVSKLFGQGDMDSIRELFVAAARYLMIIGIPLAIGGIVLAEPIILVFYGTEYSPVVPLLQIMFIPFAFKGIADVATSVIYGMNQPSFVFKMGLGLVILAIGLELWLIPIYGVTGAAIGSSIPRLLAPLFLIHFALKQCQASWPFKDTFKIILSSIIMGGIVFGINSFIQTPIISLVVLIPLGILIQVICLLAFRVFSKNDIEIFRSVHQNMPSRLQGLSGRMLKLGEMLIQKKKKSGDSIPPGMC